MDDDRQITPMFHLVYCSTAVQLFSEEALHSLLAQSRERNAVQDITGLLLYHNGGFVQVLEGEEATVRRVFSSILRDERHHSVITVIEEPISERAFPHWRMAFRDLSDLDSAPEGFSDFLTTPFNGREFSENPSRCQKLLLSFKKLL